eukprot:5699904-Pyramimonas_sp.AAC.1
MGSGKAFAGPLPARGNLPRRGVPLRNKSAAPGSPYLVMSSSSAKGDPLAPSEMALVASSAPSNQ